MPFRSPRRRRSATALGSACDPGGGTRIALAYFVAARGLLLRISITGAAAAGLLAWLVHGGSSLGLASSKRTTAASAPRAESPLPVVRSSTPSARALDGGADAHPTDAEAQREFTLALIEASCDGIDACCAQNGYEPLRGRCQRAVAVERHVLAHKVAAPGMRHDPVAAAECLALTRESVRGCGGRTPQERARLDAVCERVWTRSVALGAECETDAECRDASGDRRYCVPKDGPNDGDRVNVCESHGPPTVGAPCSWARFMAYCEEADLTCDLATERCVAKHRVGEACDRQGSCVPAAYCDADSGRCEPRRAEGSECVGDIQCGVDARCDGDARRCQARVAPAGNCTHGSQCASYVCEHGKCLANTYGSERRCRAPTRRTDEVPSDGSDIARVGDQGATP